MAIEGEARERQWRPTFLVVAPAHETRLPVADGFELDVVGCALLHDGKPVHLRPREFQLLATLAANPGQAFTRSQLIDLAWGRGRDVDPRTVDVHVHWLRAKIELQPGRPIHLVTVRGFGYRFDPAQGVNCPLTDGKTSVDGAPRT
jgi:DNA-binding response OmpR family regulator